MKLGKNASIFYIIFTILVVSAIIYYVKNMNTDIIEGFRYGRISSLHHCLDKAYDGFLKAKDNIPQDKENIRNMLIICMNIVSKYKTNWEYRMNNMKPDEEAYNMHPYDWVTYEKRSVLSKLLRSGNNYTFPIIRRRRYRPYFQLKGRGYNYPTLVKQWELYTIYKLLSYIRIKMRRGRTCHTDSYVKTTSKGRLMGWK